MAKSKDTKGNWFIEGIKNIQRENTATKSQKKLITEEEQEANNSHEKSNLDRFISTYSPSKK